MAKARRVKQITFTMPDRAGQLSQVANAIAAEKVNITSICAYGMKKTAYFMLNTSRNAKVGKALAKLRVKLKEEDVVEVEMPNRVGQLNKIAKKIGNAGINIEYMYGTAGAGKSSICIFKTSNDRKVVSLINK